MKQSNRDCSVTHLGAATLFFLFCPSGGCSWPLSVWRSLRLSSQLPGPLSPPMCAVSIHILVLADTHHHSTEERELVARFTKETTYLYSDVALINK